MATLSKRQFLIRLSIRNPSRYKHDLIPHRELSFWGLLVAKWIEKFSALSPIAFSMFVWRCITNKNNMNSQLNATITNFIDNYNQLNMFRAIISPILMSTRLCLQLVAMLPAVDLFTSR